MRILAVTAVLMAVLVVLLVAVRWYVRHSLGQYDQCRDALARFQSWQQANPHAVVPSDVGTAARQLEHCLSVWEAQRAAGVVYLDTADHSRYISNRLQRLAQRKSVTFQPPTDDR